MQPHYDIELGKICGWLKANGYTMHVTLAGEAVWRNPQPATRTFTHPS